MVPLRRHGGSARAGFTLLELLLVIVLITVLAGVISVTTRPDPHEALAVQARRVALLVRLASDEARLRRASIDWEADLRGYRFVLADGAERNSFAGDDLLRERLWEPALTRLAVVDLASGSVRTLVSAQAPALRVPTAQEWIQPRWRLEMGNELASVAVDFDANGNATVVR